MPRVSLLIDRDELLDQLLKAEKLENFRNYTHLFEYVASTDWGQNIPKSNGDTGPASVSTISKRVSQWNLTEHLKTTKGEIGGNLSKRSENVPREKRSAKFKKVKNIKAAGIEIGAWTVNDRATMKRLLEVGVERLYTDDPRLLLSLKSKTSH